MSHDITPIELFPRCTQTETNKRIKIRASSTLISTLRAKLSKRNESKNFENKFQLLIMLILNNLPTKYTLQVKILLENPIFLK